MIKKKSQHKENLDEKHKKSNSQKLNKIRSAVAKIFIIVLVMSGFLYVNNKFENTVALLAINENERGEIISGSKVDLNLVIKPGSGEIYTNLNTLEEIDTQISIINSHKIACDLFELNCNRYDFFYTFNGSAIILKGPSASSAIGILTAKTVKKEKIDKSTIITGSLNSGGIIGNVGGVDKKIEIAQEYNYTKVLVPVFSDYDKNKTRNIEVIEVFDLVDAYNAYSGKNYIPKEKELNMTEYKTLMKELGELMCTRSLELQSQVNIELINENSSEFVYLNQARKSYNSSQIAKEAQNYYSQGSFCYNSNINYRILIEKQKNLSLEKRNEIQRELQTKLDTKYVILNSEVYMQKVQTINDFYVYAILNDRIDEAREFLREVNENKINTIIENINSNTTNSINSSQNKTTQEIEEELIKEIQKKEIENKNQINQKEIAYSYSMERGYTVDLWETFLTNTGTNLDITTEKLNEACVKINREVMIKEQLLTNYGINIFATETNEIKIMAIDPNSNKYLCLYKGLELNGKYNTILNSIGIEQKNQEEYVNKIVDITKRRLTQNSNNENFPLIPYIYYEYAQELGKQGDVNSAILYSNYALSYSDINLYIETKTNKTDFMDSLMKELFSLKILSLILIVSLLVILGFAE